MLLEIHGIRYLNMCEIKMGLRSYALKLYLT